MIQRYSLVTNCDDQTQNLLEDLPVSLTYDIAKPSAESSPAKAQAKSEVLAGEINAYQRVAGEAIFEIGRRLKHVKENDLAHGEWSKWLKDSFNYSHEHARRFLKVYERFSKSTPEWSSLPNSITVLYALTDFTDEELEQTYELPSGESKKPTKMSRREIETLKAEINKEREAKEQAERQADIERKERERLEEKLESQSKKIEQVYPDDYEKIKRENAEYRAKYGDSEGVRNIDDKKREKVYEEFAQELERMRLKYASIALDGANVDLYASANPEYASKINSFNDFWKMYVKTVSNDQIIIEVESV